MPLEKRQRFGKPIDRAAALRRMLPLGYPMVVKMRDGSRGSVERVQVQPELPGRPAVQAIAEANLVRAAHDRRRHASIDPFGQIEDRVRSAVENEVPTPSPGLCPARRRPPQHRTTADAAISTLREDETSGVPRRAGHALLRASERQADEGRVALGPFGRDRIGHPFDVNVPLDDALAMHVLG